MSFFDERRSELVLDLVTHRISELDFAERFPLEPGSGSAAALAMLQVAVREQDGHDAEYGLYLACCFGYSAEYVEVLCALAEASWHQWHEDVVNMLDELRDPASVDVLYRVALSRHPYRDYDEHEALGVKCVWALYKIGTEPAVERLVQLMGCDRPFTAQRAEKRLRELASDPTRGALHARACAALGIRAGESDR